MNGNKIEKLIFSKKFNKLGKNTITFICKEKINNMNFMFNDCSTLKEIEFISFDTSEVTSMKETFRKCSELEYLNLNNFNTSNVTDMENIFGQCHKLKEIKGIEQFKTNNVTKMSFMFDRCYELKSLDLSNFNTSNVTSMGYMFYQCYNLEFINLSGFNIKNCRSLDHMFYQCYKLKEIKGINDFDKYYLSIERTITDDMLSECNELKGCEEVISLVKNKRPFVERMREIISSINNVFDFSHKKEDDNSDNSDEKNEMQIKCTYEIKDINDEIQIINDKDEDDKNEEIEKKVKILNGNEKEDLKYKKKFNKIGLNTIIFICEKN